MFVITGVDHKQGRRIFGDGDVGQPGNRPGRIRAKIGELAALNTILEEDRALRLAAKLRELGLDPEQF